MHCEALRICLHAFNYAGAFVGEVRRICLHAFDYAGAFVGEARRICLHTFNYAGAFVGICIVGPGAFVYIWPIYNNSETLPRAKISLFRLSVRDS